MNKKEFVDALAQKGGYTKKDAEGFMGNMLEVIEESLVKGEVIRFIGFGTFSTKTRAARTAVNPRNREETIEIPETKVVNFKAGKDLKDKVNKR